ncbi:MAG: hypothetical protein E7486_05950 [Ruminococcaceae bacterium]|nr:hypothetical protein [Oscillospiraceae bacterium]
MTKQQTIDQLQTVYRWWCDLDSDSCYLKYESHPERQQRMNDLWNGIATWMTVPSLYSHLPHFADTEFRQKELAEKNTAMKKQKTLFFSVLIASILCAVVYLAFQNIFHPIISNIQALYFLLGAVQALEGLIMAVAAVGFLASIFLGLKYSTRKEELKKEQKRVADAQAAQAARMKRFRQALSKYETEKESGIANAKAFGQQYRTYLENRRELEAELQQKWDDTTSRIEQLEEQLREQKTIPCDYIYLIPEIIQIWEGHRADSYKEALNLAIEDDRKREEEAARQREAARQEELLLQQARETARHNKQMEREAAQQTALAQKQIAVAEEQLRATEEARKERQGVPGVGYRDQYGNYYNYNGVPIPPPKK